MEDSLKRMRSSWLLYFDLKIGDKWRSPCRNWRQDPYILWDAQWWLTSRGTRNGLAKSTTTKSQLYSLPIVNPTTARKRAKTQNAGENADTKWTMQQINPQMNRGRFLPNLSETELTIRLPMKKAAKMTEVETNPKEPRSHTSSNCGKKKKLIIIIKSEKRISSKI